MMRNQAHGKAGLKGGGHEVKGHDGGVPAGNDANGEIEADDAMDGDDKRGWRARP